MSNLEKRLRNKCDLYEYFDRLPYIEMMELLIQLTEVLYDVGCIYPKYDVPEQYRNDPDEPDSLSICWSDTDQDISEALTINHSLTEEDRELAGLPTAEIGQDDD